MAGVRRRMLAGVMAVGTAVRLVGWMMGGGSALVNRVEVVSGFDGWIGIREGLFLREHTGSSYSGASVHSPPLVLALVRLAATVGELMPGWSAESAGFCLILAADAAVALGVVRLAEILPKSRFWAPVKDKAYQGAERALPIVCCAMYWLSPLSVVGGLARAPAILTMSLLTWGWVFLSLGAPGLGMAGISGALYTSPAVLYLVVPSLALAKPGQRARAAGWGGGLLAALIVGSGAVEGWSWHWMDRVWGDYVRLADLRPGSSLFWYFFVEVFPHFRHFFGFVFHAHIWVHQGPLVYRLGRSAPWPLLFVCLGLATVFQPYPSLPWSSLLLALVPLQLPYLPHMRYSLLVSALLTAAALLAPIAWHGWINLGSGNPNFVFAPSLMWSLGHIWLAIDSLTAVLTYQKQRSSVSGDSSFTKTKTKVD